MLDVFQVGYCNGTLPGVLPKAGEIIDGLKTLGVLNRKGRDTSAVVSPCRFYECNAGNVPRYTIAGASGRASRRTGHLYLPGPHRGVWNGTAAKTNQTLFIAEAILDGLALWQAGFKNVIAIYGTNGWTPDHEQLLKDNGITEVFPVPRQRRGRQDRHRTTKGKGPAARWSRPSMWFSGRRA